MKEELLRLFLTVLEYTQSCDEDITWPLQRRGTAHSPRFSETLIAFSFSKNAEQRYEVDVVVLKFGFAMLHRPFSCFALLAMTGEGKEG